MYWHKNDAEIRLSVVSKFVFKPKDGPQYEYSKRLTVILYWSLLWITMAVSFARDVFLRTGWYQMIIIHWRTLHTTCSSRITKPDVIPSYSCSKPFQRPGKCNTLSKKKPQHFAHGILWVSHKKHVPTIPYNKSRVCFDWSGNWIVKYLTKFSTCIRVSTWNTVPQNDCSLLLSWKFVNTMHAQHSLHVDWWLMRTSSSCSCSEQVVDTFWSKRR